IANNKGSEAKSNSRRCFTFVNVTTPTAPNAVLPTKFAVAEKHMDGFSPRARITPITAKRKIFLTLRRCEPPSTRPPRLGKTGYGFRYSGKFCALLYEVSPLSAFTGRWVRMF